MIRAVVKNGVIQPTDPLPQAWSEGHEVLVTDSTVTDPEQWYREMEDEARGMDPQDGERLMAALATARAEAKELARNELRLP
jgi:hypothetical protein